MMKQQRQRSWRKQATACGVVAAMAIAVSFGTRLTAHDDDDARTKPTRPAVSSSARRSAATDEPALPATAATPAPCPRRTLRSGWLATPTTRCSAATAATTAPVTASSGC